MSILSVIMFLIVSVLLFCGGVVQGQFNHRRHQHHYMQHTSTTTPSPPIKPRFPHLDRILNRLDDERLSTPKPIQPAPYPSRRPSTWEMEQAVLAAHPEMLRDDWMFEEEDEEESEETSAEDHHQAEHYRREHLARHQQQDEAATSAGGSSLTRFKWYTLGTRQDVARTRARHVASEKDFQAALQHAVRVLQEGNCQVPRPRVVRVSDVYPHPSKTYIPSCTILHQCGDDTGCCSYEGMACVAKYSHPVELPFYTSTVGAGGPKRPGAPGAAGDTSTAVERLLFYNHTECECQDRSEMPRDTTRQKAAAAAATPDTRHYLRLPPSKPGVRSFRATDDDKVPGKGCRCPSEYSVRQLANGTCVCDCFDRQRECLRFKKGKNSFSVADRSCVLSRECREPACEFGAYIPQSGRCPVKWEQYGMTYHHSHHQEPPIDHKTHHKPESYKPPTSWQPEPPKPASHFPWNPPSKPASASQTKPLPSWDIDTRGADHSKSPPWHTPEPKPTPHRPEQSKPSWSDPRYDPSKPIEQAKGRHQPSWLTPTEHRYPWNPSTDHKQGSDQNKAPHSWLTAESRSGHVSEPSKLTSDPSKSGQPPSWPSPSEHRHAWNPTNPKQGSDQNKRPSVETRSGHTSEPSKLTADPSKSHQPSWAVPPEHRFPWNPTEHKQGSDQNKSPPSWHTPDTRSGHYWNPPDPKPTEQPRTGHQHSWTDTRPSWGRSESRVGGYPWNPAEVSRKTSASSTARSTWSARSVRDTRHG